MKSGYEVIWTNFALSELAETFEYLEFNFTDEEISRLAIEIEHIISLISENPLLFPKLDENGIRRIVILKYNNLNYRIIENSVEIISFFSNRQSPDKQKLF